MSKLTVADVTAEVERIRAMRFDDEMAHNAEDELHQRVLAAIADGNTGDPPAVLAREALKTRDIEFARWCA